MNIEFNRIRVDLFKTIKRQILLDLAKEYERKDELIKTKEDIIADLRIKARYECE